MGKTVRTIAGTNEEILAQLQTLATADKKAESTWKSGCVVMFFGGLGLFIPAFLHAHPENWQMGLCGVVLVVGIVLALWGRQGDVDDSRYQALHRMHRFLSGDTDKNAHYHYVLDLRPYTHRSFYLRTEKFGGWFNMPRGKFEFFTCPVLKAHVKLRDGTVVAASAHRMTKKRTRTKPGRSGKVKTKVVEKYSNRFHLSLKLPDGLPGNLEPNSQPLHSGYLNATVKRWKCQGQKVSAASFQKSCGQPLEIDGLLQLMAVTFHKIHLARQSAS